MRLAYIGGGSMFVPSIANGIGQVMQKSPVPYEVDLALYDVHPEKAEHMRDYVDVVGKAWHIPLHASVSESRQEALQNADMVLVSAWLEEEHERLKGLWQRLGREYPEDGLGVAAWAAACARWSLEVTDDMLLACPQALFLTLMNPTDVLAGLVKEARGLRTAGLCVEVDGMRGALAYYFGVPSESIELTHAGVNHDGWILGMKVNGEDGYRLWQDRWQEITKDPDYHPGNRGILPILELTGRLRSSAYHNWPYEVAETTQEQALWGNWRGKRESYLAALEAALKTGTPIEDPAGQNPGGIHPERSRLNYPHTGITLGKLVQSLATGQPNAIPLQIPNQGAIANFPDNAIVEVPTRVEGINLAGQPVGELPEWLGGTTRLLAIQRRLLVEYLLDQQLATLKRALAVLPMLAPAQQLNEYAEAVHDLSMNM
jgi:alpha-galactosidase/6-phospho-beta-glucosidase family protein